MALGRDYTPTGYICVCGQCNTSAIWSHYQNTPVFRAAPLGEAEVVFAPPRPDLATPCGVLHDFDYDLPSPPEPRKEK